ncbi:MAG: hypothetical protein IJP38_09415 [Oscillospiraceae bacterium]|nr:hypothetical protein [Oscillospiraceae bacterium]
MLTLTQIVHQVESKKRNTFEAECISIRNSSAMFQIIGTNVKSVVYAKDVAFARLNDLTQLFCEGDIYPITIYRIVHDETESGTRIRLFASLKPAFGTREEVVDNLRGETKWMPVVRNYIDGKTGVLVSPNVIAIEDFPEDSDKVAVYAQIKRVSERGKIRLHIVPTEEPCPYSGEGVLHRFFLESKKDMKDIPPYTDVAAFSKGLFLSRTVNQSGFDEDVDLSLYDSAEAVAYPQPQGRYNSYFLMQLVGKIKENGHALRTLELATRLFRGFYTAQMVKELEECDESESIITQAFWSELVANNIVAKTKIACGKNEIFSVFCNSLNFRCLAENSVPKFAEQMGKDADWILRGLSVNRVLLGMYKKDKSILNGIKRNWMVGKDLSDRHVPKFRALAIIEAKNLIIDSCRSTRKAESIAQKVIRINEVLKQVGGRKKIYIICRNEDIENRILKTLRDAKLQRVRAYTATDSSFEQVGEFRPVKAPSFFERLFGIK